MTATIVYADGITEYPRVTVSGDGVARASYWMGRKASGQLWERVAEGSANVDPRPWTLHNSPDWDEVERYDHATAYELMDNGLVLEYEPRAGERIK